LKTSIALSIVALALGAACSSAPTEQATEETGAVAAALTYGEVELIDLAAKAIFKVSVSTQVATNMESLLRSHCGGGECSEFQICQILNLGSAFPMPCAGLPTTPAPIPPHERAFRMVLRGLPETPTCAAYFRSLQPGTLQINLDGHEDPLWQQCLSERRAREDYYVAHKVEVLARLGYGPNGEVLPPPAPAASPTPSNPRPRPRPSEHCYDHKGHRVNCP
jgi:hypothetical protein